jgi:hypothetical protein
MPARTRANVSPGQLHAVSGVAAWATTGTKRAGSESGTATHQVALPIGSARRASQTLGRRFRLARWSVGKGDSWRAIIEAVCSVARTSSRGGAPAGDDYVELPVDPTDEELARDWTLSVPDLEEVRKARGPEHRQRSRCSSAALRALGRFVEDFATVAVCRGAQASRDSKRAEQRIRDYLDYRAFHAK